MESSQTALPTPLSIGSSVVSSPKSSTVLREITEKAYTEPSRYATPRWKTSPKQKAASEVAWRFRQLFFPTGWVPLPKLRLQAFRLFKAGWTRTDILSAMEEAQQTPWRREIPKTLWFFLGWIKRIRMRQAQTAERMATAEKWRYTENPTVRWDEGGHVCRIGDIFYRLALGKPDETA